jgi:hypothetical protein
MLACELLFKELNSESDPIQDLIMKRIRAIAERIIARCRQQGANLNYIVGSGVSPVTAKPTNEFVDIYASTK